MIPRAVSRAGKGEVVVCRALGTIGEDRRSKSGWIQAVLNERQHRSKSR